MGIERVSILGVGLLGGSIGLAVKRRLSGCTVVGYGHRPETLRKAKEMGAIDEGHASVTEAVAGADLVILCTPVGLFDGLLKELGPALKAGAIVTDVGSTKRSVVAAGDLLLPDGVAFVGSHPMAGSEKRGVEYASADLFEKAVCILTPTAKTDPKAADTVRGLWNTLGMRVVDMTTEEHDRCLAQVSHLPHAVAAALIGIQHDAGLAVAGKGFLDATRIAGGDGGLWRDILLDNRDNVLASIEALTTQLRTLSNLLKSGQGEELARWLDDAARRRNQMGKSRSV